MSNALLVKRFRTLDRPPAFADDDLSWLVAFIAASIFILSHKNVGFVLRPVMRVQPPGPTM